MGQLNAVVGTVAVSALSAIKNEKERICRLHARISVMVSLVVSPIAAAMIAVPESFISLLFGSNWMSAAPLMRIFACAVIFQSALSVHLWVLQSLSRTGEILRVTILQTVVMVAIFFAGTVTGSLTVTAAGYIAGSATALLVAGRMVQCAMGPEISVGQFLNPVSVAAGAIAISFGLRSAFETILGVSRDSSYACLLVIPVTYFGCLFTTQLTARLAPRDALRLFTGGKFSEHK
jgi:O-antigen/teichoic acid export membrane protein